MSIVDRIRRWFKVKVAQDLCFDVKIESRYKGADYDCDFRTIDLIDKLKQHGFKSNKDFVVVRCTYSDKILKKDRRHMFVELYGTNCMRVDGIRLDPSTTIPLGQFKDFWKAEYIKD